MNFSWSVFGTVAALEETDPARQLWEVLSYVCLATILVPFVLTLRHAISFIRAPKACSLTEEWFAHGPYVTAVDFAVTMSGRAKRGRRLLEEPAPQGAWRCALPPQRVAARPWSLFFSTLA